MRLPYAGLQREDEVVQLAAEAGLNEKAFAEALRQKGTAELAGELAAACRCYLLLMPCTATPYRVISKFYSLRRQQLSSVFVNISLCCHVKITPRR